jgi:hypothetical protein
MEKIKTETKSLSKNAKSFLVYALLIISIYFIFLAILNSSWVLPEQFFMRSKLLESGSLFSFDSIKTAIDWRIMEIQPRYTRPLSNITEFFDTNFRALLWEFIVPIPSLKISNIFLILLAPLLVYKTLKNLGCDHFYSILGIILFILSPGFLSHLIMDFRPGKAIILIFVALQSYFCTKQTDRANTFFLLTLFLTFLSVFFDEFFLVVALIPFILRPEVFLNMRYLLLTVTSIVIALAFMLGVQYLLFEILSIPFVNPLNYNPVVKKVDFSLVAMSETIKCFEVAITEGIFFPTGGPNYVLQNLIRFVYYCIFVYSIFYSLSILFKERAFNSIYFKIISISFIILLYCIFHSLSMSRVDNNIWGIFYYGTYISFFSSLLWIMSFKLTFKQNSLISLFFVVILVSFQFHAFLKTNNLYKDLHFYPHHPLLIMEFFQGNKDRFEWNSTSPQFSFEDKHNLWVMSKNGMLTSQHLEKIPRNQLYIPIESQSGKVQFPIQAMWNWGRIP